jgi:HK97 family phage major capsid protein
MPNILKALNETTDASGGYLVPDQFAKRLFEYLQQKSVMLKVVETVQMTSDLWKAPKLTGGTTARWIGENATITSSDTTFDQVTMTAQKVAALTQLSTELMEDSFTDVMRLLAEQMAIDLAYAIDDEMVNGTNGKFENYMRDSTITNINTVTASTHGDTIAVAKFSNAIYEIVSDQAGQPDYCIVNPRVTRDLRNLTDANDRPLWDAMTYDSPLYKNGVIGTVMGLKVIESTVLPLNITKGTSSTCTDILVVKSKKCGIFGRRRNLTVHKDYDIDTDSWKIQSNLRCAFNIPYPKAICIIKDIT